MDEESVKVIMAVVVFMGMVLLVSKLFAPGYSETDEVAASYFESLENAMSEADFVGSSSFFILDNGNEDLNFYLVYFGNYLDIGNFHYKGSGSEFGICICAEDHDNFVCNYCKDAGAMVVFSGSSVLNGNVLKEGFRLKLSKEKGYYEFSSW